MFFCSFLQNVSSPQQAKSACSDEEHFTPEADRTVSDFRIKLVLRISSSSLLFHVRFYQEAFCADGWIAV